MKNLTNRLLNYALYLVFCLMLGTGIILEYRLPHGSGGRATVLGLGRHEWGDWHYNIALLFLILIIWHLWMNRIWLFKIAGAMKSWRILLGLLAGAVLVAILALMPVQSHQGGRGGGGGRQQSHSQPPAP